MTLIIKIFQQGLRPLRGFRVKLSKYFRGLYFQNFENKNAFVSILFFRVILRTRSWVYVRIRSFWECVPEYNSITRQFLECVHERNTYYVIFSECIHERHIFWRHFQNTFMNMFSKLANFQNTFMNICNLSVDFQNVFMNVYIYILIQKSERVHEHIWISVDNQNMFLNVKICS